MNGPQDLGGHDGLRPDRAGEGRAAVPCRRGSAGRSASPSPARRMGDVEPRPDAPCAREHSAADYLAFSYYQIWITALIAVLQAKGIVGEDELAQGRSLRPAAADQAAPAGGRRRRADADARRAVRPAGGRPARFKAGDAVRALNINPVGHTRLPRYARGKRGVVERVAGGFVFPDSNAHWTGREPAMGLHRACSTGGSCGARTPTRRSACRSTRGSPIWSLRRERARAGRRDRAGAAGPAAGRRGAGVRRALGGAGLRHGRGAARARAVHLDGMGGAAGAGDQGRAGGGRPRHGRDYYRHWLAALESLVVEKGAATARGLAERRDAWDRAARATPHGQPILLENDPEHAYARGSR